MNGSRVLACMLSASWMLVASSSSATDGVSCSGTVATIGVHGTDRVVLRLSGMNEVVQICHLNQTMGTTFPITAQQCKAAYSTLLTAHVVGKVVNVWFDNVQTGTSCTTFVGWEVATARWVHLSE